VNEYRLAVDLEVLEQLLKTDEAQRQQIVDLLARLRHQPFLTGDLKHTDTRYALPRFFGVDTRSMRIM
jgi:hypothetical protein